MKPTHLELMTHSLISTSSTTASPVSVVENSLRPTTETTNTEVTLPPIPEPSEEAGHVLTFSEQIDRMDPGSQFIICGAGALIYGAILTAFGPVPALAIHTGLMVRGHLKEKKKYG